MEVRKNARAWMCMYRSTKLAMMLLGVVRSHEVRISRRSCWCGPHENMPSAARGRSLLGAGQDADADAVAVADAVGSIFCIQSGLDLESGAHGWWRGACVALPAFGAQSDSYTCTHSLPWRARKISEWSAHKISAQAKIRNSGDLLSCAARRIQTRVRRSDGTHATRLSVAI